LGEGLDDLRLATLQEAQTKRETSDHQGDRGDGHENRDRRIAHFVDRSDHGRVERVQHVFSLNLAA